MSGPGIYPILNLALNRYKKTIYHMGYFNIFTKNVVSLYFVEACSFSACIQDYFPYQSTWLLNTGSASIPEDDYFLYRSTSNILTYFLTNGFCCLRQFQYLYSKIPDHEKNLLSEFFQRCFVFAEYCTIVAIHQMEKIRFDF